MEMKMTCPIHQEMIAEMYKKWLREAMTIRPR